METQGITMKLKALVTFAKPYLVAEGGTTNEGITINYLLTDNLTACENPKDGSQGYKFSKSSLPVDRQHKLTAIPGFYEMDCEMSVGSTGTPVLKPFDLNLLKVCELKLNDLPSDTEQKPTEQKPGQSKK